MFYLICQLIMWGFRYEELKIRQNYNDYKMIESQLQDSRKYKITMFRELDAVAFCESGHDNEASNDYSSALGKYQIIDSTLELCEKHLGRKLDRTIEADSQACAVWLWQRYGLRHWSASKWCWEDLIK